MGLQFPTNPNIGDWYVTPYGKWQWTGEVWQKYRYTMTDIQNAVTSTVGGIWTKGDTEPTSPEIGHYWLDTTDYTLYNYEGAEIGWVAVSFEESAAVIPYDNSTSGLVATDIQGAIDEVEGRVDSAETAITTNANNIATKATVFDFTTTIATTDTWTLDVDHYYLDKTVSGLIVADDNNKGDLFADYGSATVSMIGDLKGEFGKIYDAEITVVDTIRIKATEALDLSALENISVIVKVVR